MQMWLSGFHSSRVRSARASCGPFSTTCGHHWSVQTKAAYRWEFHNQRRQHHYKDKFVALHVEYERL
jgi:hypothetical protein